MEEKRALIAMSGGVDSSVAAYLMQQAGYDIAGVTLKLFDNGDVGVREKSCCSQSDVEDAKAVAYRLGIHHYTLNFRESFQRQVMDRFVCEYERGRTPNPCIDCNRYIKFSCLLERANVLHYPYIVTGHYARIVPEGGRYLLKKGLDSAKDQSYVLYAFTQRQMAHILLPLGELEKSQVRLLAEQAGFVNARKRDSQDICFVPDGDYGHFLEEYTGKHYPAGDFLNQAGQVVGRHRGAVRYTLGQRKGLGLAMGEPVYVCGKDMAANTVTVGPNSALYTRSLVAEDCNWIAFDALTSPLRAMAQTRYRQPEQPVTVTPEEGGRVRLTFDSPQRAVTPGQAVVLYDGDVVLGGGTIVSAE